HRPLLHDQARLLCQLYHRHREIKRRAANLLGLAVDQREWVAQGIMTLHQRLQTSFKRLYRERAPQREHVSNVITRNTGLETIKKPDPLLRERERITACRGSLDNRRHHILAPASPYLLNLRCQSGYGWGIIDCAHR